MQVGAVGFSPFIYNTNRLNTNSLSKVKSIGNDLTSSRTDFSGLMGEEGEILNPLKKGETLNFMDVLDMQMHSGRLHAAKIMKEPTQIFADNENKNNSDNSDNLDMSDIADLLLEA